MNSKTTIAMMALSAALLVGAATANAAGHQASQKTSDGRHPTVADNSADGRHPTAAGRYLPLMADESTDGRHPTADGRRPTTFAGRKPVYVHHYADNSQGHGPSVYHHSGIA